MSLLATPRSAARQASRPITSSWHLLKLMSIALVMPSNHLILCRPLLLPPSVSPSIRVFSNESALHIRWPEDWSFSFNISPSKEYSGLTSFRMGWFGGIGLINLHWEEWTSASITERLEQGLPVISVLPDVHFLPPRHSGGGVGLLCSSPFVSGRIPSGKNLSSFPEIFYLFIFLPQFHLNYGNIVKIPQES